MAFVTELSSIEFIDLKMQLSQIRPSIDTAIARVLSHGQFILGPEVKQLEEQLATFTGAQYSLTCANGTDALVLALRALGVTAGSAVCVPTFTFAATAEAVALLGGEVIFVDSDENYNICPEKLRVACHEAKKAGLNLVGIITVDLFGLPAAYEVIHEIAREQDLWILGDAAQSFGAVYHGKKAGNLATISTTSFFPAKPLGCFGDGGAIFTNDAEYFETMKSLRVHGQGTHKYDNVRIGYNSRLDTLQAAILLEKLKIFPEELQKRQAVAARYASALQNVVTTPPMERNIQSAWAQYTVRLPEECNRAALIELLKAEGIPAQIYYPNPLHLQTGYRHYQFTPRKALQNAENFSKRVLSLPMHPYLLPREQDRVIEALSKLVSSKTKAVSQNLVV